MNEISKKYDDIYQKRQSKINERIKELESAVEYSRREKSDESKKELSKNEDNISDNSDIEVQNTNETSKEIQAVHEEFNDLENSDTTEFKGEFIPVSSDSLEEVV